MSIIRRAWLQNQRLRLACQGVSLQGCHSGRNCDDCCRFGLGCGGSSSELASHVSGLGTQLNRMGSPSGAFLGARLGTLGLRGINDPGIGLPSGVMG